MTLLELARRGMYAPPARPIVVPDAAPFTTAAARQRSVAHAGVPQRYEHCSWKQQQPGTTAGVNASDWTAFEIAQFLGSETIDRMVSFPAGMAVIDIN